MDATAAQLALDARTPNGGRRQLILDAATDLFMSRPYDTIHVDEVCERAGVASHGLIAYHFQGKRGLYVEVLRRVWEQFLEFQRPALEEPTIEARLRSWTRLHFAFIEADPQRFLSLVQPRHSDQEMLELLDMARRAAVAQILAMLELPVDQPRHLRAALRGVCGYFHEVTMDWLANRDLELEEVADLCFDMVIDTVRTLRYDVPVMSGALTEFRDRLALNQPAESRR